MRMTIAGLAAAAVVAVASGVTPAAAMPAQPAGITQDNAALGNVVDVQYRRRYGHYRYYAPRRYGYRPYYGYRSYDPYGYGYGGYGYYGPSVRVGPMGFGFRW